MHEQCLLRMGWFKHSNLTSDYTFYRCIVLSWLPEKSAYSSWFQATAQVGQHNNVFILLNPEMWEHSDIRGQVCCGEQSTSSSRWNRALWISVITLHGTEKLCTQSTLCKAGEVWVCVCLQHIYCLPLFSQAFTDMFELKKSDKVYNAIMEHFSFRNIQYCCHTVLCPPDECKPNTLHFSSMLVSTSST